MATKNKDTVKQLRGALNEILHLIELTMPQPDEFALTAHETPVYIVNRVRALAMKYSKTKALQDQVVQLFRAVELVNRLSE
jgi:hypothetical protein